MVNVNKLRGKIVEKQTNVSELSKRIGIDKATFYRKLSENGETFLVREVDAIVKQLGLDFKEATTIFFSQYVA